MTQQMNDVGSKKNGSQKKTISVSRLKGRIDEIMEQRGLNPNGIPLDLHTNPEDAAKAAMLLFNETGLSHRYDEDATGEHEIGLVLFGKVEFGRRFCAVPYEAKFHTNRAFAALITYYYWDNHEGVGAYDVVRHRILAYVPNQFMEG